MFLKITLSCSVLEDRSARVYFNSHSYYFAEFYYYLGKIIEALLENSLGKA